MENKNAIALFLKEGYAFRRNILSGHVEFSVRPQDEETAASQTWRILAVEDLNSLTIAAESAMPDVKGLAKKLSTYIYSRETPDYDPVREWLQGLPAWDGKNHVGALLDRLPGLRSNQRYWFTVWLRSMVAHWLQMDNLHGNEVVPTLIGDQGCGKSTFCRLLLPEHLRGYFLDHVNLANKFDKEMALTHNLLVNIDELDQVGRAKQAELKQLLSKSKVNGRPIYGRTQDDRLRYASFVATTNNLHPLHDPTGSRRFLCIEITSGRSIDCSEPFRYDQIYAQLLHELGVEFTTDAEGKTTIHTPVNGEFKGERYWLTEEEVRALQISNAPYESTLDLERIVTTCFRHPAADEPCEPLTMTAILDIISRQYPFVNPTHSTKIQVGFALAACGFEMTRDSQARHYYVVPKGEKNDAPLPHVGVANDQDIDLMSIYPERPKQNSSAEDGKESLAGVA